MSLSEESEPRDSALFASELMLPRRGSRGRKQKTLRKPNHKPYAECKDGEEDLDSGEDDEQCGGVELAVAGEGEGEGTRRRSASATATEGAGTPGASQLPSPPPATKISLLGWTALIGVANALQRHGTNG